MKKIIVWIAIAAILFAGAHYFFLSRKAPVEIYPDDTYLASVNQKRAVIIVAHDDDAVSAAGTISALCQAGWNIKELCFYNTTNDTETIDRNIQRQEDTRTVREIEGLSEFTYVNLPFRDMSKSNKPAYMPLSADDFVKQYNRDTLLFYIRRFIDDNQPTVVFTLDNNIGGYGNPDHIVVSRLVLEECVRRANDSSFPVRYIYQPVFTPSMAKNILGDLPVYKAAISAYGMGMPAPDVQVSIEEMGAKKKAVMEAYSTEQNSMKQIWPYYNYYPAKVYFNLFNREFFKTIKLK
ncbi:MAG: PIG-L family deacetylase [Chitinophagaceae bacterium]